MKLVTVQEMQTIEREADANGLSYAEMMENAGTNLAMVVQQRYPYVAEHGALGLIGKGNNGGDTLVALTWLAENGWKTAAYLTASRPDDDVLVTQLKQAGGTIFALDDDPEMAELDAQIHDCGLVLDGVLGTGVRLPLRGAAQAVLATTQAILEEMDDAPYVVAVDCPSGINCDTGETAPETIAADTTVTMAAFKKGLFTFPAYDLVRDLVLVGIGPLDGLPAWENVPRSVVQFENVEDVLPHRPINAHKGTFGTALVVAGSANYTGAALLAGRAAFRVGTGLVTLGIPSMLYSAIAGLFPEATWLLLPHEMGVIQRKADQIVRKHLERVTAILLGPGFGMEDTTGDFLSRLLKPETPGKSVGIGFVQGKQSSTTADDALPSLPPMVVDADGLKLLAKIPNWHEYLPAPAVLTPHPGEMATLTGLSVAEIQEDRVAVAERYAAEWGHVVVLKGAFTVIASPDGNTRLIALASPALARAGTGDVLAGIITGLMAQGMNAFDAAWAGAWLHGQAGLHAVANVGSTAAVLAMDVVDGLLDVLEGFEEGE